MTTVEAQSPSLSNDPAFSFILLHRINYPIDAERLGIYAKIYAGFQVDRKGHVQEISILNQNKIGYGFEEEVVKKLKLLPPLNPKYEGNYALPVTFAFIDHSNDGKAMSPSGSLSKMYLTSRILLDEIKIVGGRVPRQKNKTSPQSLGQILTTDK